MHPHAGNKNIQGFSLLEVLVTMIIVAVSLLGLISLQGISKYSAHEARQHTMAVLSATDMLDRLRLNKTVWLSEKMSSSGSSFTTSVGTNQTTLALPDCVSSTGNTSSACSETEIVTNDLYQWQQNLNQAAVTGSQGAIIDPVGCLTLTRVSSSSAFTAKIVIAWQEHSQESGEVSQATESCGTSSNQLRQYVIQTTI